MTTPSPALPETLDAPRGQRYLLDMLRVRRFEEQAAALYAAGKIHGFLHLYVGEEAVAAGALPELGPEDSVFATYREHGHALLRGVPAGAIMAEMYGKAEGVCRGRGGSMHLFDASRRFYGGSAIVSGALPMAVGLALADRLRGGSGLAACFFGEGAMAEGAFHESVNLAALWRLPVLFVCENNRYAMGTALASTHAETDLASRAASYGLVAEAVDGMDVVAVAEAVRRATAAIRAGDGPRFLECRTYRFRAHSMFDPELYRSHEEVEAWLARCPIVSFEARLRARGWLGDADRAAIDARVAAEVAEAVAFAEAGSLEARADLLKDVYTCT